MTMPPLFDPYDEEEDFDAPLGAPDLLGLALCLLGAGALVVFGLRALLAAAAGGY